MRRVCASFLLLLPAALACLLPAAVARAGAVSSDEAPYLVIPGPYSRKSAKTGPGDPVARAALLGVTIAVEFLPPADRATFVKSIDPGMQDPFAARPGRPEAYSAFRVAIDNRSGADVQFQAGNVVLITDAKTQDFPVDLTDLYRGAEQAGMADPERMIDRIAPLVFDSHTTIARGTKVARLLVFGPLPKKWKDLQVHFSFLEIGTETHTVSFRFHKQPIHE
jgi:hypothetical protein